MRKTQLWRAGLAGIVLAGSVIATTTIAEALPGGTPPTNGLGNGLAGAAYAGGLRLAPLSGTGTTVAAIQLTPSAQTCPGNNNSGWVWSTFITPIAQDPALLTFETSGQPVATAAGTTTAFRRNNASGTFIRGEFPDLSSFAITEPSNAAFASLPANLTPGKYTVGIACTDTNGPVGLAGSVNATAAYQNEKYWATTIDVAANPAGGYIWGQPAVPALPALTPSTSNLLAPTVNFTQAPAIPSITGYTATLTQTLPAGGPTFAAIPVAVGASTIPLPALTLGRTYTLTMVATNTLGDSGPSNTVTLTPSTVAPAPIPITVPNPFERAGFSIGWTAPVTPGGGPAPTDYTVEILTNPASPGVPAVVTTFSNVVGTTQAVAAVPVVTPPATPAPTYPIGNYTARVTANYAPGSGVTPTAGSQSFSVTPNSLIFQEITVERPLGALVLTQRCGVYGALDPFVAVDAFPGFPRADATGRALVASTPGIDERPDTDVSPAGNRTDSANPALDEYTPDPLFGSYPEQGTYPTECGLDMGTASLVTSGALAGQFYTASGRLNQVTVLDTRDTDIGWAAKGDIDDLFQQGSGSPGLEFDGNYLGWVPKVTSDSNPVGGSTYNQTVTAGATVLPGTGTPGAATPASPLSAIGLRANPTLASAPALAGLGIATLDARMNLLIPASVDRGSTGLYTATLSLTVA